MIQFKAIGKAPTLGNQSSISLTFYNIKRLGFLAPFLTTVGTSWTGNQLPTNH